jgi:hypothetical protein
MTAGFERAVFKNAFSCVRGRTSRSSRRSSASSLGRRPCPGNTSVGCAPRRAALTCRVHARSRFVVIPSSRAICVNGTPLVRRSAARCTASSLYSALNARRGLIAFAFRAAIEHLHPQKLTGVMLVSVKSSQVQLDQLSPLWPTNACAPIGCYSSRLRTEVPDASPCALERSRTTPRCDVWWK